MKSFRPPPPPSLFSSPPQDTGKPSIPYTRGQSLIVLRHIAPPPLGKPYPNSRPITTQETLKRLTQFEYCLSAAPLGEQTSHTETLSLVITKELAVRDGRGAQLVVVNDTLVAKIYDPLYYPTYHQDSAIRIDVVERAERDYSREAATYIELDGRFGGTILPKYHGSWTCKVPVNTASKVTTRPVRLILMEFVDGVTMLDLDPHLLAEEQKTNIMVKAVEANNTLHHHGVIHADFCPRNVICSGGDLGSASLRVVLIDFNRSRIRRLIDLSQNPSSLPLSPIVRYKGGGLHEFTCCGWVPFPADEWLWSHWGDSPLYQAVTRGEVTRPIPRPPKQTPIKTSTKTFPASRGT